MKTWRLIVEPRPLAGTRNMAVDEHLFRRARTEPETFLRFYRWARPTASLGASQTAERVADLEFCRRRGVDIVRRITGGKLVLHDREVTYAVASADVEAFGPTLAESYRRISQGLMRGLELMGLAPRLAAVSPPEYIRGTMPCFAFPARDEVELDGRKIIGSAQKRMGVAFVQHGSIPLEKDEALLRAAARPGAPDGGGAGMTSLSEALGREASFDEAAARLALGMAEFFGVRLEPTVLGPAEEEAVTRLETARYGSDDWTFRRQGPPI
jgi:lipoate-protein ligase A